VLENGCGKANQNWGRPERDKPKGGGHSWNTRIPVLKFVNHKRGRKRGDRNSQKKFSDGNGVWTKQEIRLTLSFFQGINNISLAVHDWIPPSPGKKKTLRRRWDRKKGSGRGVVGAEGNINNPA